MHAFKGLCAIASAALTLSTVAHADELTPIVDGVKVSGRPTQIDNYGGPYLVGAQFGKGPLRLSGGASFDPSNPAVLPGVLKLDAELSRGDNSDPEMSNFGPFLKFSFDRDLNVGRKTSATAALGYTLADQSDDEGLIRVRAMVEAGDHQRLDGQHTPLLRAGIDARLYFCDDLGDSGRHKWCIKLDGLAKGGGIWDGYLQGKLDGGIGAYYHYQVSDNPAAFVRSITVGPELNGSMEGDFDGGGKYGTATIGVTIQ